jgi:superfamily I DNA/RNA helicase
VATAAAEARAAVERTGAVAVIAPPVMHEALVSALADAGAVASSADALDAPIAVLDPTNAKGLEFDHVVVVEPAAVADDGDRGLRELYVALTRPTKTLVVVHSRPLPQPLG